MKCREAAANGGLLFPNEAGHVIDGRRSRMSDQFGFAEFVKLPPREKSRKSRKPHRNWCAINKDLVLGDLNPLRYPRQHWAETSRPHTGIHTVADYPPTCKKWSTLGAVSARRCAARS